jgi:hypothetical protein
MDPRKENRINLVGWWLFVISALFFTATSLRAGDMLSLLGSLFFLVACFVFLIPYALRARAAKRD